MEPLDSFVANESHLLSKSKGSERQKETESIEVSPFLMKVSQIYTQGFIHICSLKEGEKKNDFLKQNFVTVKSVQKDFETLQPVIDVIHQICIKSLKIYQSAFLPFFSGTSKYYFLLKKDFKDLLQFIDEKYQQKHWKQFLEEINKIVTSEDVKDPLSDIPAFVGEFNKNLTENRKKYRKIARKALTELKNKIWYHKNHPTFKAHTNDIPAVRNAIFELYKCQDPDIKQKALVLLIEVLDSDPIKMKSAFDLVDLQQTLLEHIKAVKAQNLNTILLRLLIKAYAMSLECILLHQASHHLNALTEDTKLSIWDGATEVKKLNVNMDLEIKFWTWYAIQAAQHIKADKSDTIIWLGRVGNVLKAGIRIYGAAWGDASLAADNVDGAVQELKQAVSHLEWHEKSFKELLILKKIFRYSINSVEMFRNVVSSLQSRVIHPEAEDNFVYGIITSLEQAAVNSRVSEVQEETLKVLIQFLGMDNHIIQVRVLFAFTQMLHLKNRVGNTTHVITKLLQACGKFDVCISDPLFVNIGRFERNVSFHLAKMNKEGMKEELRDTYFLNVLKFLLRRLAFIRDYTEGQSLVTMLVHSNSEKILPPLLRCLKEFATDLILPDANGNTPCHIAAERGSPSMLLCFQACIPGNINAQEHLGRTPLHIAVSKRSEEIVKTLLAMGSDPHILDFQGNTALHLAVDLEEGKIVQILADQMKNRLDQVNHDGKTVLNIAIEGDSVSMTQLLLPKKAKIAEHAHQFTSISLAAKHGSENVLRYFLNFDHVKIASHEALEIIRMISPDGKTIKCSQDFFEFHLNLMHTSRTYYLMFKRYPQWDIILKNTQISPTPPPERRELTLKRTKPPLHQRLKSLRAADIDLANYEEPGNNILIKCAQNSSVFSPADLPVCNKDNIDELNWVGITPIATAVICFNPYNAASLINAGANLNRPDVRGFAPLHWAVLFPSLEMLDLLINSGNVIIDAKNDWGDTPFLVACGLSPERRPDSMKSVTSKNIPHLEDRTTIIERLLKAQANPEETDILGNNALHHAFAWAGPNVVGYLIHLFPEMFWKRNAIGNLPIQEGIIKGNQKTICQYLNSLSDKELMQLHTEFIEQVKKIKIRVTLPGLIVEAQAFGCFERLYQIDPSIVIHADFTPRRLTPLHYSVKLREEKLLEFYAKNKLSMNLKDSFGENVAHYAVMQDDLTCVKMLMPYQNLWNRSNRDLRTPLHCAAIKGNPAILQCILSIPGIVNSPDGHGDFPLHHACKNGHTHAIPMLCKLTQDFEELRNDEGYTPGHLACAGGHIETFNALLECIEKQSIDEKQVDIRKSKLIEARNNFGITPLMLAGIYGNDKIVARLIELHADPYAKEQEGKTLMHLTVRNSHSLVLVRLLALEKRTLRSRGELLIHTVDAIGEIPLLKLAKDCTPKNSDEEAEDVKCLKSLLDAGSEIGSKNIFGETFIHLICRNGHIHFLSALSNYYEGHKFIPCINEEDKHKNTPVHKACQGNQSEMLKMLVENNHADFKAENEEGLTPALLSAKLGFCELLIYLLKKKVNPADKDKEGRTLLHLLLERETLSSEQKEFALNLLIAIPELAYERDKRKRTLLHVLAEHNHVDLVESFLQNLSGDLKKMEEFVKAENGDHKTALAIAQEKNFRQFVILLQEFPRVQLGVKAKDNKVHGKTLFKRREPFF